MKHFKNYFLNVILKLMLMDGFFVCFIKMNKMKMIVVSLDCNTP
ncbi:hypothetical protein DFLDMN_001625 [Cupriavidus sp. H19C3]